MRKVLFTLIFCSTLIPVYPQVSSVEKANQFYSTGMGYYESGHYDSLIYYLKEALNLRKNHPRILYNLAAGYALNGNNSEALNILNRIADMKLYYPAQQDSDFASIMHLDGFNKILKKFDENIIPVVNSTTAFILQEKGLLTEGIAFDRQTNKFFISSVHKRKILEYDEDGNIHDFNSDADSLLGIFGMCADYKHGILWAAAGAIKNMEGFNDYLDGKSILYRFNLSNGNMISEYEPPEEGTEHLFGDLTMDLQGNVYVSDSRYNAIYKLTLTGEELKTIIPPGNFISLQGIAFNENDSILYAADYSQGIFRINMHDKSVELIQNETATTLLGIDGLYFHKGRLIATQNGVNPQRIVLLKLNSNHTAVSDYKILESNNPLFDEPTLGVITGNEFYFIANSQWSRFDKNGTIYPDEELDYPLILRITLE